MGQNKQKVVQSFVTAIKEVVDIIVVADTKMQAYKTRYQALNPSLSGTNVTQAQLIALNGWISDLNTLATSAVVTTVNEKHVKGHDVKGID